MFMVVFSITDPDETKSVTVVIELSSLNIKFPMLKTVLVLLLNFKILNVKWQKFRVFLLEGKDSYS